MNNFKIDKIDINCNLNAKLPRINDQDIVNITIHNYNMLTKYNYTRIQLKNIAKLNKLPVSLNKKELIDKIYRFFYVGYFVTKIQKIIKGYLLRKCNTLRGPAFMKRHLCTNNIDFLTMEPLNTLLYSQFFSYADNDNFIYGFDIMSLHNLICKSENGIQNPYNRNEIPSIVVSQLKELLHINNTIFKTKINIEIPNNNITFNKNIISRIIGLFQDMDSLGNYTDPNWILSLSRIKLIQFISYLTDIWNYRLQIPQETKNNICPPSGDIFRNINLNIIYFERNIDIIRTIVVDIISNLIKKGINNDYKTLGCYYTLGALTLVNDNASISLHWLFQAFSLN